MEETIFKYQPNRLLTLEWSGLIKFNRWTITGTISRCSCSSHILTWNYKHSPFSSPPLSCHSLARQKLVLWHQRMKAQTPTRTVGLVNGLYFGMIIIECLNTVCPLNVESSDVTEILAEAKFLLQAWPNFLRVFAVNPVFDQKILLNAG